MDCMSPIQAVGQIYRSFRITKYLPLKELQSTLIEAIHEPTGALVMHVANEDPENLFCLSFRTLPSRSDGVAHILEHTVLCGSKKFPIKDPFFSMTRRSLNTYMNALTGQDFTCYPASSQVEKDFYNLLDVYLDSVFHPELKKMSFLQEGHRLEFTEPQNPKSPLQFQGVVYNEMKGALSSPESRLWELVMKHLTPDLPYAVNSGGDPKHIPELTYEELKKFHATFYHPSRCIFFFYGNLPLTKHLDFLLENALHDVKKQEPLPLLPLQKRYKAPVQAHGSYPVTEAESGDAKTWIAFSFLTAPLIQQEDVLALCLLDSLLMDTDASCLKNALLKSKLCTAAESSVDIEMSEVPFTILCKGCEAKSAKKLKEILFDTLKNCTFTKEQIEASIHQLEFDRTEINAEGIPFGLTLFFRSGLIKQHGSEPENALLIHTLFQSLRRNLKNPDFLPSLMRKYLLDNPHYVELTFSPDPTLESREKQEEEEKLSQLRPHIDAEKILKQTKELAAYQESIETQSLDCLPKITLNDVPQNARDFPLLETKIKSLSVFRHECFTNQILYVDLIYDLPHIEAKDLPLVSLYTKFMTELGCGSRNYAENLEYQQAYTGGVNAALSLNISQKDPDICHPILSLRGKCLERNSDKLFSLFADFISGAKCDDPPRIQELLLQHATEMRNRLTKNALSFAIQTALKGLSPASFVYDEWNGLSYYQAVLNAAKNPKNLVEDLMRIQELVLAKGTAQLVLSCEKEQFEKLEAQNFFHLADKLPKHSIHPWTNDYILPKQKPQVHFISAPVAFTARGQRTVAYKDPRSPFLLLATELLENCHLHKEIREKGGAYGSGASYAPHTGNFHFYSFRDPHLAKTLEEFQKALEKIGHGKFTKEELEEAKFGVIQTLDAPVPPGNRAMTAYAWKKSGRTFEARQHFRKAVLSAKKEDVAEAVKELLLPETGLTVSFIGETLFAKEKKKLKHPLEVMDLNSI